MQKRLPFFYGWMIVITMAIVTMAQTASFNPVLGIFLKPITAEFEWSRATFAGAISVGTISGGFFSIVVGPLLDKFGPRWILFLAFFFIGWAILGLSFIQELWHFYGVIISMRTIVSGVIAMSVGVVISKWFIDRRGRAQALASTGTRIGNSFMPLYVQTLISGYGWRVGAMGLGILTWSVTLIPTILFLRRRPEDLGLVPDGNTDRVDGNTENERASSKLDLSLDRKQAMRTPAFYFILFATSSLYYGGAGINFNLFPFFTDQGIDPDTAVRVMTTWALISAAGGLLVGFLAEKIHVRFLMSGIIITVSLGIGLLSFVNNVRTAYIFAFAHGIPWGGIPMLQQLVWADYFGRESQGAIRGVTTPVQMLMNAMGPLTTTLIFDATGSYEAIFRIFAVGFLFAGLILLLAKPPNLVEITNSQN
ncbi:MAG: MFS transporter [Chloroflexota bacterium]|nr:MFS transporter [Chloroflexota bacterium]